jgi:serine protease
MGSGFAWVVTALLVTGGCGGGGGGAPPGGGGLPSSGTGGLSGVLLLTTSNRSATVETEPNDTLGAPHDLGQVLVGQSLTVFGEVDAAADANDGFRLRCPQRALVTAKLTFVEPAVNDLELLVYDPTSLQIVERFPVPDAVSQVMFTARATFDVVVTALAGTTGYQLDLSLNVAPTALTEREPNDATGQGQYTGVLFPGERLSLFGFAHPTTDPSDVWLIPFPLAATLELDFTRPAFNRFDVDVLDGTADVDAPTLLATVAGPSGTPTPIAGSVVIPSGTLVVLRVRAVSGNGGSWTLSLRPTAPPLGTPKPGLLAGRPPAPLEREAERVPGMRARYGRVDADLEPGEVLVGPRPGQDPDASVAGAGGAERARIPEGARLVRVPLAVGLSRGDASRATLAAALALDGAPGVRYAEPNYRVQAYETPDDELYPLQWHYELIRLPQAWDHVVDASHVIVAVLDTGITPHPDLQANLITGYDFVTDPSSSRDGDGMDPDPFESVVHGSFHGTHVAGTIGAVTNNDEGVAGVAWGVKIMPLRVIGHSTGAHFDIATAILYAARLPNASGKLPIQRAHVINMSLGNAFFSATTNDACRAARDAGVVIVASSGNAGSPVVGFPAGNDGVIAVGATDVLGRRTTYSNYGTNLDLMAPGGEVSPGANGQVLSTYWDDFVTPARGTYEYRSGTSMASPHVAGVAALMFAVNPTLTGAEVTTKLMQSARDMELPGYDLYSGWGLVDAYQAVFAAMNTELPPEPPRLHLNFTLVDFGAVESDREVSILNLGTEALVVDEPQVVTTKGGTWLTASLEGPATDSVNAPILRLHADRTGLLPGGYEGDVTLTSNGGTVVVHVKMAFVPVLPPLPVIPLRLFVKNAQTGDLVRFVDVDANRSYQWDIPSLPVGQYLLTAGTDLDQDGFYEDDGEYVGAWPSLDQPWMIEVGINQTIPGLRLNVSPRTSVDTFAAR